MRHVEREKQNVTESDHLVGDVCILERLVIMAMVKAGASASKSTPS